MVEAGALAREIMDPAWAINLAPTSSPTNEVRLGAMAFILDESTHRNLSSSLDLGLGLLWQDLAEIGGGSISSNSHGQNHSGKSNRVNNDLGELREMPSVPFFTSHSVGIQLLVEIVKKCDSLDNHDINLVGTELKLVSANRVGKTKRHGGQVLVGHTWQQLWQILSNSSVDIQKEASSRALAAELNLEKAAILNCFNTLSLLFKSWIKL
ncbi:hypothetical protein OGAPHI_004074 [Ogataea philodendri]|uniref:Uncharacterized protein n=1 Tax=Ogataea philodendri TaxID=1378263 RepID=A0A9P8T5A0_9ASCO|nr:uncharacterized protein OGAPHI_004074 [Ogataea philodendri]KAH3665885.1 hypothetical protein OGAPHI_004074 [Ogataea philodendri]